jgi:ABC-type transport system substrate-binding protein
VLNFSDDFFITDGIYTENQARFGEIPESLPYDPERAKRLFEEAGWHDRNANRIRDKDGREFHFTVIVEDGIHKQAAVYIQDQLRRVGIRMEIQNFHRSVIMQRFRDGKFDAAIVTTYNGGGHHRIYFGKFDKDVYSGYAPNSSVRGMLPWKQMSETVFTGNSPRFSLLICPLRFFFRMLLRLLLTGGSRD